MDLGQKSQNLREDIIQLSGPTARSFRGSAPNPERSKRSHSDFITSRRQSLHIPLVSQHTILFKRSILDSFNS
jgi:hypothetical protein